MAFPLGALERFFKVLGDDNRLRILQTLAEGERSVSEILEGTRLPQTLASFHLRILREAGVVATDRRGPFVYYRLADPSLLNLLEACAVGRPVIVGPHTFNFQEATEGAIEAGAALRVADAPALAEVVASLFRDPGRREAMAEAGMRFTQTHRGATERTMAMLKWQRENQ